MRVSGFRTVVLAGAFAAGAATGATANEGETLRAEAQGPHSIELFFGGVRADNPPTGHETAFSAGLSYHYHLSRTMSVGLLAEHAFDPVNSWVFGVPFVFNIGRGWQLTAMPGAERHHGNNEFLFRAGIGYEIEMDGYSLTPQINADWVDGEVAVVVGLGIGFRF